jgi:predicted  nucleic acid-binding Zn-ribbon protein
VSIDIDSLKSERDRLKSQLREVETKQRTLEAELKSLRQSEIRSKREIEALSTLIELNEPKPEPLESTSTSPA